MKKKSFKMDMEEDIITSMVSMTEDERKAQKEEKPAEPEKIIDGAGETAEEKPKTEKPAVKSAAGGIDFLKKEKKETKSENIHLLMKPSVVKQLKSIAKKEKISVNALIGAVLENFVSEYEN